MTLPIVLQYRAAPIRPNVRLQSMCVHCGGVRPIFRIPDRHLCTGLLPALIAAFLRHYGDPCPRVIHLPLEFVK
jgi:hypothetical protein